MVKRKSALIRVQESQIMASVTGDPAMLDFYRNGGGDKMCVSHYRNVMLKIAKNR